MHVAFISPGWAPTYSRGFRGASFCDCKPHRPLQFSLPDFAVRTTAFLAVMLLPAPTLGIEVVLRDTIGPDNLGATGLAEWSPGDGDGDGDIDSDDYQVWRSQYGMTLDDLPSPPAGSVTVPEPQTAGLAALLALFAAAVHRTSNA